jgi:carboxymethylenebutenolidase
MASDECCTPAPPAEHVDEGTLGSIGGLTAYLSKPASPKAAIIFAHDVFGIDAPLLRKFADKTAAAGFYAVVPDFLNGDPYVVKDLANPFAHLAPWLAIHHPDSSVELTKAVIKELKEQGIESIGISGFCWGARLAAIIGKEDDLVKGVAILYPSLTTLDNIKDLKVPTAFLAAELDNVTTLPMALEFKEVLDKKPFSTLVRVYPGQYHGWSVRYDVNDPHQVKGAEEAQDDMLEFYKKVLL